MFWHAINFRDLCSAYNHTTHGVPWWAGHAVRCFSPPNYLPRLGSGSSQVGQRLRQPTQYRSNQTDTCRTVAVPVSVQHMHRHVSGQRIDRHEPGRHVPVHRSPITNTGGCVMRVTRHMRAWQLARTYVGWRTYSLGLPGPAQCPHPNRSRAPASLPLSDIAMHDWTESDPLLPCVFVSTYKRYNFPFSNYFFF